MNTDRPEHHWSRLAAAWPGHLPRRTIRLEHTAAGTYDYMERRLAECWGEAVYAVLSPSAGGSGRQVIVTRVRDYPTGVYRVPSGGIDHGERPEEAARREATEELGLVARVAAFIGLIDFHHIFAGRELVFPSFAFLLTSSGGDFAQRTHDEIADFHPADAGELWQYVDRLRSIGGTMQAWGAFRSASTALVADFLEKSSSGVG
ncbi:MAG: NUDIX hydrolase [Bacillota bacterium]